MHRDKFPEKIPFRLTRMLMNAMEVSGIEGTFRMTCENVMRVLRENKGSLMAMLEAFAHDPIINWRLLTDTPGIEPPDKSKPTPSAAARAPGTAAPSALLATYDAASSTSARSVGGASREARGTANADVLEAPEEVLNGRAVAVIARIHSKLTGKDFGEHVTLDVQSQVQRLVEQATSHENLCQCKLRSVHDVCVCICMLKSFCLGRLHWMVPFLVDRTWPKMQ